MVSTGSYNRPNIGRAGPAADDVFRGVIKAPPQPPDKVGEHDAGRATHAEIAVDVDRVTVA